MKSEPVVEDGVDSPNSRLCIAAELADAKSTFVQRCPVWLMLITALKGGIR